MSDLSLSNLWVVTRVTPTTQPDPRITERRPASLADLRAVLEAELGDGDTLLDGYPDLYELSPKIVEGLEALGVKLWPTRNRYVVRSVFEALWRRIEEVDE